MELFIRIVDGKPFEHPILDENFRAAFPDLNTNNLPPEFARFIRLAAPKLGPYEKNQTVTYEWDGDVVKDVWRCEQMTSEERQTKIDYVKANPPAVEGVENWIFDETLCRWKPPV